MAIEPISVESLDSLGIDEFNRLYWKGEGIVTVSMIDFPTWVDWVIGLAALAAILNIGVGLADRFGLLPPKSSKAGGRT